MPESIIPDYNAGILSSTSASIQTGIPIKTEVITSGIIPADELVQQILDGSKATETEVDIYKIKRPYRETIKAMKINE